MNQGDSGRFAKENGVYQDGGMIFNFGSGNGDLSGWQAVFLAFATQATQTAALQRQLTSLEQQLSGITRPVADFEKHLTSTRADALAAKQATEGLEGRLARIEAAQRRSQALAG